LIIGLIGIFAPNLVSFNKSDISLNQAMIIVLLSIVPLVLFFLIQSKFILVNVDEYFISIENCNKKYKWNEVIIRQVPFVFPPLYKLNINGKKGFQLFNTDNEYLWVSFGIIKDLSSMGGFIRKMTKIY